jgi:hypothetical protein
MRFLIICLLLASCATPKYYIPDAHLIVKNNRVRIIPFGEKIFLTDTIIRVKIIRSL